MIVVPRAHLSEIEWDHFVDRHPSGWFWQTSHWLEYCLAYAPGSVDHSIAFLDPSTGAIRGLVPLVREGAAFTMGGHPGAPPLLSEDVPFPIMEKAVQGIGAAIDVHRWIMRSCPAMTATPDWRQREDDPSAWSTYVVDLRPEETALWQGLRKSYRHLIRQALGQYQITLSPLGEMVHLAHGLHVLAAGRETRSQRTWDLMATWATRGFLWTALALKDEDPRGMALVIHYKQRAYYASGATVDPALSHALIWMLMMTLRSIGTQTFEIGWGTRAGDTPKERGIAFFKSGFGGSSREIAVMEIAL